MKKVVVLLIIIAVAFGVYSFQTEKEHQEMKAYVESKLTAHAKTYITVVAPTEVNNSSDINEALSKGENVILTEGLVLQDRKIWADFLKKDIIPENNTVELYFEEPNLEAFVEKMEKMYPEIKYVNTLMEHSWGQKVVRFYDLDGNLIEVGTPM